MALNEAMLANLTADELAHYAACTPGLMEQVSPARFLGSVTEQMEDLKDEVSYLSSEVERKEGEHVLDYWDHKEAMDELNEAVEALREYCEEFPNDHPVSKIWHKLNDASDKVRDLY